MRHCRRAIQTVVAVRAIRRTRGSRRIHTTSDATARNHARAERIRRLQKSATAHASEQLNEKPKPTGPNTNKFQASSPASVSCATFVPTDGSASTSAGPVSVRASARLDREARLQKLCATTTIETIHTNTFLWSVIGILDPRRANDPRLAPLLPTMSRAVAHRRRVKVSSATCRR